MNGITRFSKHMFSFPHELMDNLRLKLMSTLMSDFMPRAKLIGIDVGSDSVQARSNSV